MSVCLTIASYKPLWITKKNNRNLTHLVLMCGDWTKNQNSLNCSGLNPNIFNSLGHHECSIRTDVSVRPLTCLNTSPRWSCTNWRSQVGTARQIQGLTRWREGVRTTPWRWDQGWSWRQGMTRSWMTRITARPTARYSHSSSVATCPA